MLKLVNKKEVKNSIVSSQNTNIVLYQEQRKTNPFQVISEFVDRRRDLIMQLTDAVILYKSLLKVWQMVKEIARIKALFGIPTVPAIIGMFGIFVIQVAIELITKNMI